MATEKRERHFLKRYLERRMNELYETMWQKIEQISLFGATEKNLEEYGDAIARLDEVYRVIEVCEKRGRF